jgi:hypothetical protein
MQLNPSDFIAWAAFVLGGLIAMKKPKKVIGWFLIIASGGYLLFAILSSGNESKPATSSSVTATVSGSGSTAQAAGHDINNGIPTSALQQVLNLKDVELSERMLSDYPHGCIILGLENGKVIYESRLKDIVVNADWNSVIIAKDTTKKTIGITIPNFSYRHLTPGGLTATGMTLINTIPFAENEPVKDNTIDFSSWGLPSMYYEVLDASKGILLIGFK